MKKKIFNFLLIIITNTIEIDSQLWYIIIKLKNLFNTYYFKEVIIMLLRVGEKAPEIEATAYHQGEFKEVKLSDYDGKWRVVCFYPGDFTFV